MDSIEKYFDIAFSAPDGTKKLRELILKLAMQGKLAPQNPQHSPASKLLIAISDERAKLEKSGEIKRHKLLTPFNPEQIPYEIPKSWAWVRIADVSSYIQRGKGPEYVEKSQYRVISQKCVRWDGLDLAPAKFINPKSLEKYESIRFLRAGDLLWNSTGTGTIGRACLFPMDITESKLVADSHVTVVRSLISNPHFLFYWIKSPYVQSQIENNASGTTNQIELNLSTVVNHPMPLPPLEEQVEIVSAIDKLMLRCDELEKLRVDKENKRLDVHTGAINALLKANEEHDFNKAWQFITKNFSELYSIKENVAEFRKAILQLAVMGKLVPQNPNDKPASELLKEIHAEKEKLIKSGKIKKHKPLPPITEKEIPFSLPRGWEWVRLGDLVNQIISGFAFKSTSYVNSSDCQLIRLGNVKNGNLITSEKEAFLPSTAKRDHSEFLIQKGDILLTMTGTRNRKDYLFSCLVKSLPTGRSLLLNQRVGLLRFSANLDINLIDQILKSSIFLDPVFQKETGTANQGNIGIEILKNALIMLPPQAEQSRISSKIYNLISLCDQIEKLISDRETSKTSLLTAITL